jgi:hemerythrin
MEKIEWNADWLTGFNIIDEQHQHLIKTLNSVINGTQSVASALNELIEYTAIHFYDEESLMLSNKYPKIEEHIKEHRQFKMLLLDISFIIMSMRNKANSDNMEKIKHILKEFAHLWFKQHFLEVDKPFINYINSESN